MNRLISFRKMDFTKRSLIILKSLHLIHKFAILIIGFCQKIKSIPLISQIGQKKNLSNHKRLVRQSISQLIFIHLVVQFHGLEDIMKYASIVRGQIYGHAHGEFFKAMNVAYISSSMTTYTYLTPSFRKFEVHAKNMIPKNQYQYRFNLDNYKNLTERLFDEPELVKKFDLNSNSGQSIKYVFQVKLEHQ